METTYDAISIVRLCHSVKETPSDAPIVAAGSYVDGSVSIKCMNSFFSLHLFKVTLKMVDISSSIISLQMTLRHVRCVWQVHSQGEIPHSYTECAQQPVPTEQVSVCPTWGFYRCVEWPHRPPCLLNSQRRNKAGDKLSDFSKHLGKRCVEFQHLATTQCGWWSQLLPSCVKVCVRVCEEGTISVTNIL